MEFETDIRTSFTDEAKRELKTKIKSISNCSTEELILMGISALLTLHSVDRKYLSLDEEAIRLKINRRLARNS